MATPKTGPKAPKMTPEVVQLLETALAGGNFRKVACDYAGIGQRTFRYWMQLGKEKPRSQYAVFRKRMVAAEHKAEMAMVASILSKAKEDPKHAEWWLARKYPNRWGKREEHRMTGPKGGPLAHEVRVAGWADLVAIAREATPAGGTDGGADGCEGDPPEDP